MLTPEETKEIQRELAHYPTKRGVCIEALKIVQRHRGWVSDDNIKSIADMLEMSAEELDGVATFYNLIFRRPVGKHVILLCDSVSCWVTGCEGIRKHLEERLGVGYGETTGDGRFTLLPMPCLGTCDHGPAMMVGDDLHQDLTPESVDRALDRITANRAKDVDDPTDEGGA